MAFYMFDATFSSCLLGRARQVYRNVIFLTDTSINYLYRKQCGEGSDMKLALNLKAEEK